MFDTFPHSESEFGKAKFAKVLEGLGVQDGVHTCLRSNNLFIRLIKVAIKPLNINIDNNMIEEFFHE